MAKGWMGRLLEEHGRQVVNPAQGTRVSAPGTSAPVGRTPDVEPSTLVNADGTGVDLLILDVDELDSDKFYLGDNPIEPSDEDYARGNI